VQEENHRPQLAYDTYTAALDGLRAARGLSGRERLRAVALAHKLGDMAEMYQQPAAKEERWRVYAVEELLRTLRDEQRSVKLSASEKEKEEQRVMLDELELPAWVEKMDVVVPLQSLGKFYNQRGQQEYARLSLCCGNCGI
jgi:hypothetical protein